MTRWGRGSSPRDMCASAYGGIRLLSEHEDEVTHEAKVIQEQAPTQTDRDVEQGRKSAGGFRLASHTGDVLATGETVTDRRADGAPTEGDATADHGARERYCLFHAVDCHVPISPSVSPDERPDERHCCARVLVAPPVHREAEGNDGEQREDQRLDGADEHVEQLPDHGRQ